MTNEDRAVIEAAEEYEKQWCSGESSTLVTHSDLLAAIRARRKALEPKPRYYIGATKNNITCNNIIMDGKTGIEVSLLKAVAALNEQENNRARDAITRHFHGESGTGDARTDGSEQSRSEEQSRPSCTPATRHPKTIIRFFCDGEKFTVLPESETISMKDLEVPDE